MRVPEPHSCRSHSFVRSFSFSFLYSFPELLPRNLLYSDSSLACLLIHQVLKVTTPYEERELLDYFTEPISFFLLALFPEVNCILILEFLYSLSCKKD